MQLGARLALAVSAACLVPAGTARAAITVANTADAGAGSLRQAIADAAPGDAVVVPAGTYTLTSGELAIAKSLTITGAGAGVTTVRSGGPFRVVHATGAGNAVTIGELTIRDGRSNAASGSKGGGILNEDAALTLHDVTLAGNRADADGAPGAAGGVAFGGGVYSTGAGSLTLRDSVISGNVASTAGGSGKGGGVAEGGGVAASRLTLAGTLFDGNGAYAQGGQGPPTAQQGGGIASGGGLFLTAVAPAVVSAVTLRANASDASGGPGGSGGIADGGGGWMLTNSPTIDVANVTAFGNLARASGGTGGIATGGGLYYGTNNPGAASLTNATLNANAVTAPGSAGGGNSYLGGVRTRNTIIAAGVGPAGKENCGTAPISLGHNVDSLNQCGFTAIGDLTGTNPLLGPLQDNGGPVPTEALSLSSPSLNAGDNAGCPATDARGISRPQGVSCDMGAYEAELPDLSVTGSGPPRPVIGRNVLVYLIAVRNTGKVATTGAAVSVAIPAGATFVSATTSVGSCSGGGPVSCALGGLAGGGTATVQVVVRPRGPGTLVARATATSTTPESSAANNTASVAASAVALAISRLSTSPATFRLGSRLPRLSASRVPTGTTIRFTLPEAARVTLRFDRASSGRRSGRRCVAATRRNRRARRCTRYAGAGALTLSARAGSRRLRFEGRLSRRRALAPGAYRLRASATDTAGSRSAVVVTRFRLRAARGR